MSDYRLTDTDTIIRISDGAFIPTDPLNADRLAYEAWITAGNVPEPYVPLPAPIPSSISDRQFFQQLAVDGVITEAEAEAAVATGEVPAPMLALVDQLPQEQRFSARMLLKGATTFERHHPMTLALAQLYGWDAARADALFTAAAQL